MAVVQYGSLVTEIKGSLGGHTFKSQRGTKVIMNKSAGFSRSKQLDNRALGFAGYIFQRWKKLDASTRLSWENEAAVLLFPDKYGNQVHISGRELYTKLQLQLGLGYTYDVPSGDFSSGVSSFVIVTSAIDIAPDSATMFIVVDSEAGSYLDITAEVSVSPLNAPVYRTRRLLQRFEMQTEGEVDFTEAFFNTFPYVTNGYYVRLYVSIMNQYGFKGVTSYYDLIVGLDIPTYEILRASVFNQGLSSEIIVTSGVYMPFTFAVYAQVSSTEEPEPDFNSALIINTYNPDDDGQLDLQERLRDIFPDLVEGDYVRFWTVLRYSGTNYGTPQTIVTQVLTAAPNFTLDTFLINSDGSDSILGFTIADTVGYEFDILAKASATEMPSDSIDGAVFIVTLPLDVFNPLPLGNRFLTAFPSLTAGWNVRLFAVLALDGNQISMPQSITTIVGEEG